MSLTDLSVKSLKPSDRPYKKADGKGLSIVVMPSGEKLWRYRYRRGGKETMLSLGSYPDVSLSMARAERDRLRRLKAEGKDPSLTRRKERLLVASRHADTFKFLGEEYLAKRASEDVAQRTLKKQRTFLNALSPDLGPVPIREIDALLLLAALRKIEARGKRTLAQEARAFAGRVFRYAVAQGRADRDVSADIRDALLTPVVKGRAGITDPKEIGTLLKDIRGYQGDPIVSIALELLARLFVRPGELREAKWEEFDLDGGIWRIPAHRTKLRREHIVPLPPQSVTLLRALHAHRVDDEWVVGSRVKPGRPMSDMAFNKALRSLGYDRDRHVSHGFRSTASTLLNEQGFNRDWIERQLAHVERNKVRGAYNAAEYLEGRTAMLRSWNDYLDTLIEGA